MLTATALLLIGTFTSQPGENMDQFVTRVAPEAMSKTRELGVELCGAVGVVPGGYTLNLEKGKRFSCKIHWVAGEFSGMIFHTHTDEGNSGWADTDLKNPGYLVTPHKVLKQRRGEFVTLSGSP